eukprot:5485999-Amphidinium_carterae.1
MATMTRRCTTEGSSFGPSHSPFSALPPEAYSVSISACGLQSEGADETTSIFQKRGIKHKGISPKPEIPE